MAKPNTNLKINGVNVGTKSKELAVTFETNHGTLKI